MKGAESGVNNTNYVVPASQAATALTNSFARTGLTANFFGIRGTEDLGGGMKAFFNLQSGVLDMSTGSNAVAFSRESHVGLSGGFGSVKVGRSVSTACSVGCSFDYNYIGNGSAYALNALSPASMKASSRRSNQIEWTAPSLVKGLTTRVATIMKGDGIEDPTFTNGLGTAGTAYSNGVGSPGNATAHVKGDYKAVYALGLNYDQGPLRLAYVVETQPFTDANLRNVQWGGAEYNFGAFKANVQYSVNGTKGGANRTTVASTVGTIPLSSPAGAGSGKGWGGGVSVPLGSATVGLQYADNTENKTKATELFARYSLSKRTELYSYYTKTSGVTAVTGTSFPSNNVAAAGGTTNTTIATNALIGAPIPADPTILGLGVRHTF